MKHQPTTEQQHSCKLAASGETLLIEALAGTGKTTTGKFIAQAVPDKTCLSIFFNKKNAEEGMAQKDRPSNMFYSTIHSLCYKQIMNEGFKSKLNDWLLFEDIDTSLLKKFLGEPMDIFKANYPETLIKQQDKRNLEYLALKEYAKELGKLQRIVLACMKLWQQSDAAEVYNFVMKLPAYVLQYRYEDEVCQSIEALAWITFDNSEEEHHFRIQVATTCEKLWLHMINPADAAKITHDTYVKLFQLQGRTFTQVYDVGNKMYMSIDLLILDEVQDSNRVTLSIFNNQVHLQRIACGDKNQNLYAWRGAMNDFSSFDKWNKASLTESFRFGQDIADLANKVLALPIRNTKLRLVGRGTDEGTGQTAILCRTNAAVLRTVFSLLLQDEKVACVSKFSEMEDMMYHVFAILADDKPKFPVASLKSFDTKEKMWQAIESNQELAQVYKLAKMISDAKGGLYSGLKYLKENLTSQEKADYVVSTIHASKGLGFTKVVIGEDFLPYRENPEEYYELVEGMKEDNAMTSLLYVAITRAMKEVVLPSYLEGVL